MILFKEAAKNDRPLKIFFFNLEKISSRVEGEGLIMAWPLIFLFLFSVASLKIEKDLIFTPGIEKYFFYYPTYINYYPFNDDSFMDDLWTSLLYHHRLVDNRPRGTYRVKTYSVKQSDRNSSKTDLFHKPTTFEQQV